MEFVTLNNGVKMPKEGFGVFQVPDPAQCEQAVLDAIASGYRLIDTAAAYMNEKAVGEAIKKCGVPREELFITTKLWVQDAGYEEAKKAIQTSLDNLGLSYLDLYLIHQPMGDYIGAYRAMEEAYKEGRLKAIGVCNFYPARLADLCETVDVMPAVNQVELHPFYHQDGALRVMEELGVQPQAWAPLCEGLKKIFSNKVLEKIGGKHGKTAAQTALRWNVDRGVSVVTRSSVPAHMQEDYDIWDFTLSEAERQLIDQLDLGYSEILDYGNPCITRMFLKKRWLGPIRPCQDFLSGFSTMGVMDGSGTRQASQRKACRVL